MSKSFDHNLGKTLSVEQIAKGIKRHIMGTPQRATLRVARGFLDVANDELGELLSGDLLQPQFAPQIEVTDHSIELSDIGWRDLVSFTAHTTTVREVLWHIGGGRAGSARELKNRLQTVRWPLILAPGTTLALRVQSTASQLFHEGKVTDIVAGELHKHGLVVGERDASEHLLDVLILHDRLTLALSLSGRPLYMRRYKHSMQGVASIKEDIAASALRATLAYAQQHGLVNFDRIEVPFAGSGTLAFEAALRFGKIPPWIFFGHLAAEQLVCSPAASLRFSRQKSLASAAPYRVPPIAAIDVDQGAVWALRSNFQAFNGALNAQGMANIDVRTVEGDVFKITQAHSDQGTVLALLNPPYGRRLGKQPESKQLYRKLGNYVASLPKRVAGFACAPSRAVASQFSQHLRGFVTTQRPFNHGGRTVYLVMFCRS